MWRKYAILAVSALVLASAPLEVAGQGGCASVIARRDIKSLSGAERNEFFEGVRRLQEEPRPNRYDRFAYIHLQATFEAHHNAKFLPWHRQLTYQFELALIDATRNPNFRVPYWDWSKDSQAPAQSIIFSDSWFGGNGRPGDSCITTGRFASWKPMYREGSEPECLSRQFNSGDSISPFSTTDDIARLLEISSFVDFSKEFEDVAHAQVHNNIGAGFMKMASPNDPLFWVHHSFVDKVWAHWQSRGDRMLAYNGANSDGSPARPEDPLHMLGGTVGSVMDFRRLCYTYDDLGSARMSRRSTGDGGLGGLLGLGNGGGGKHGDGAQAAAKGIKSRVVTLAEDELLPSADDHAELFQLRDIKPLSEEYIRKCGGNVTRTREYEAKTREFHRQINKMPDYISPSALINRKDLLQRLTAERSTFTATRGRKRCVLETPGGAASPSVLDSLIKTATLSLSLSVDLLLGGGSRQGGLTSLVPLVGQKGADYIKAAYAS
ncbi:hypothetical protein SYNPS1DRAFT_24559 [Syncephalis pseudoplumigaleata]|uniref:Tyrosinase copper-binding domain-containing protein n=1 Tax=Syncephalis pseudoplumigaleata TaxID=1712513 RepID=A0A4P9YUC2_9FUNG|nr:hypothetical protein SYNPS1DRAFT_24559 [Syncephalis pseudoplumigaleata]|eukprot:RKP23385.1 hypothetical protein SYNPS1DRAFT_24559 [Syncephalis pseudoplumigaleata]